MKKILISFLMALVACFNSSAQEKTPVKLAPQAQYVVATNPFLQNWEVSVGLTGLSFYSNQEARLSLPKSPLRSFRTNLGLTAAVTKWFSPEIALRTKAAGMWGRSVSTEDKGLNAIKYMTVREDVLINVTNILMDYNEKRRFDLLPYGGVGFARNFSHNENALVLSVGLAGTYRITQRLKTYCDLSFTLTGDEFDNGYYNASDNVIKNRDRWLAAELGLILEVGQNRWRHVADMDNIEVVPWDETQKELKLVKQQKEELLENLEGLKNRLKEQKNQPDKACVSEISVFFDLGSAELKNRGQIENLKELVGTARAEGRVIVVTGYADSYTGNTMLNEKLSARRADTIVKELLNLGVDMKTIKIVIGGGVDILEEVPANRRVVVSLE